MNTFYQELILSGRVFILEDIVPVAEYKVETALLPIHKEGDIIQVNAIGECFTEGGKASFLFLSMIKASPWFFSEIVKSDKDC